MKLTLLGLALAVVLASAKSAPADENLNYDGTPVHVQNVQLHIQGQAVTVEELILDMHIMNQSGAQPVGFWLYFYIQPDSTSANSALCQQWSNQVAADQAASPSASKTLPWLEIQVNSAAPTTLTDEGYELIPDPAISCWEALEMKPGSAAYPATRPE